MKIPLLLRQGALMMLLVVSGLPVAAQTVKLVDGRNESFCRETKQLIETKPRDVLYGVHINAQGDVNFSMNNRAWFDKIFKNPQDGITVDLVLKDRYACKSTNYASHTLPKGRFMQPVFLNGLRKGIVDNGLDQIEIKIGMVPPELRGRLRDLEGNLVILKDGVICYYTFLVNIDRALWDLLPLGLHTDTVINTDKLLDTTVKEKILYTRKILVTVPFAKSKATFNKADLKPLYDSLHLTDFRIKKIDIRAYSSVEGSEQANHQLQQARARSMIQALQQYQTAGIKKDMIVAENWVEFNRDVQQTTFASYASLTREGVKAKLTDKTVAAQLEPVLAKHRKAVVTIYLDKKNGMETVAGENLASQFKTALAQNQVYKASLIQEEVYSRIADSRLPSSFADKLEIPQEKEFSILLSNRETYRYTLGLTDEWEALENFQLLFKLDSSNGRIRYNICALNFKFWQYDTAFLKPAQFLQDINALKRFQIDNALVQRMLINYHIITCEHSRYRRDYATRDRSLQFIISSYEQLPLSDVEVFSLAKYLSHNAHRNEAEKLVAKRVVSIDVNEDLLFYYLNLQFYKAVDDYKVTYKSEIENAISLNKARFCRFFNSINYGGASFQLLGNKSLWELHCEHCTP